MRALTLAGVIQLTVAPPAIAQELARRVQVSVDNDYFNFWIPPRQRTDDNYTQGMRLKVDLARNPRFIRPLSCPSGAACGSTIEIGQDIYNPRFDSPFPVRGDRPYAGWLYARLAANGGDRRFLRVIEATAGITGKASLAEKAQLALHGSVDGFRTPLGWAPAVATRSLWVSRRRSSGESFRSVNAVHAYSMSFRACGAIWARFGQVRRRQYGRVLATNSITRGCNEFHRDRRDRRSPLEERRGR